MQSKQKAEHELDIAMVKKIGSCLDGTLEAYSRALWDAAVPLTPMGSNPQAVIDQWLHAVAYGFECFGGPNPALRHSTLNALAKAGLRSTQLSLRKLLLEGAAIPSPATHKFSFIDLFAGIGGMRLGFQAEGGRCVFSSEWDSAAQQTYRKNHGEFPFGDITRIHPSSIPEHDVLLAGFPCQPFSHAGKKLGIEDTRGTLFYDIAQILKSKRPKFALLENVRGLISHRGGDTLRVILQTLTDIGYECNIPRECIILGSSKVIQDAAKRMVLRSNDFGVPQKRQRIYILLWQEGLIDQFDYPNPTAATTRVGSILDPKPEPQLRLSDRLWAGHQRRKRDNELAGKGFGFGLVTPDSDCANTLSARYYKDGSEILVLDRVGLNPRKLSPREAARLQGFPDQFELHSSAVQAYKQFGNSVSVPVIAALARRVAENLASITPHRPSADRKLDKLRLRRGTVRVS